MPFFLNCFSQPSEFPVYVPKAFPRLLFAYGAITEAHLGLTSPHLLQNLPLPSEKPWTLEQSVQAEQTASAKGKRRGGWKEPPCGRAESGQSGQARAKKPATDTLRSR